MKAIGEIKTVDGRRVMQFQSLGGMGVWFDDDITDRDALAIFENHPRVEIIQFECGYYLRSDLV